MAREPRPRAGGFVSSGTAGIQRPGGRLPGASTTILVEVQDLERGTDALELIALAIRATLPHGGLTAT